MNSASPPPAAPVNRPPVTATVTVLTVSTVLTASMVLTVLTAVATAVATIESMEVVMGWVVMVPRLKVKGDDQPFSLISKDR